MKKKQNKLKSDNVHYIWLEHYPEDVNSEIDLNEYQSIAEIFQKSTQKFSKKIAFQNMDVSMTFQELEEKSKHFSSFLQNELQLKKWDRIALQMPNVLQYPIALYGAFKAGLVVVNVNPLYTADEMKHQFKDSGVKAVVILANFAHLLESVLPSTDIEAVIITEVGDLFPFPKNFIVNSAVKYLKKMVPEFHLPDAYSFREALNIGSENAAQEIDLKAEDIAFLQYTGGTTGVAKGAVLTHRNVIANMLQISEWMKPLLLEGKEIIITALPLYHIFSLTVNGLSFLKYGATNILVTNPRDIPGFIKLLKKHPFTVITGVNTLFNSLMNHSQFSTIDFSSAKVAVAGAMALQTSVGKRWQEKTGFSIFEGYGLTEASPVVCCNPIIGGNQLGTIGIPLPSTDVRLFDDEGKEVPQGESGELCVKGPQVMVGYWQKPDETKMVFRDGWLRTGDIAIMQDDGYFKIVDRKKDMIIVSGFNVYPNEVEDVIARHPGVLEVAAIGVEDEKSGEVVKVFIIKKDPLLKAEEVIAFAKKSLTAYKVPKLVEFRQELPKTPVGKILRRALR